MSDDVIQSFPIDFQWQTIDPFLFCVHHVDRYPEANDLLGPNASLAGRDLGQDFAGIDGWRMYHGGVVPGFPQHPHRGFETITYVRQGLIDHADSMGAAARYGRGDVQWLTAGGGIQHAEMFPLLDREQPNPVELFQIWLNLPAVDKMVEPYFTMLWDRHIPRVTAPGVTVTVVAGGLGDDQPPSPPPSSWASRDEADVAVWHLVMEPGTSWTLPRSAGEETVRVLYLFDGDELTIGDTTVGARTGSAVEGRRELELRAGASGAEVLMLQGRPIGEPVTQYGPFVMNTEDEIREAMIDYRATEFGGWPWESSDPTHGREPRRFAQHADGEIEEAAG